MRHNVLSAGLVLGFASYTTAQFGHPDGSSNSNPYSSGSDPNSDGDDPSGDGPPGLLKNMNTMVTAHAVLATLAFGLLLPSGGILIRIGSFRGLWLVHGIFQLVSYLLYIAAFAMGLYMATHLNMMHNVHPIIGIIVFVLLLFQPFLGFMHHFAFKKYSRRVVWSYGHIWLGRIAITLGIINGGLGLKWSKSKDLYPPHHSTVIGYSVAAGIIWAIYVACAIYGEVKRSKAPNAAVETTPPPYKEERVSDSERQDGVQYAYRNES